MQALGPRAPKDSKQHMYNPCLLYVVSVNCAHMFAGFCRCIHVNALYASMLLVQISTPNLFA